MFLGRVITLKRLLSKCFVRGHVPDSVLELSKEDEDSLCNYLDLIKLTSNFNCESLYIAKHAILEKPCCGFYVMNSCLCYSFIVSKDEIYVYRKLRNNGAKNLLKINGKLNEILSVMLDYHGNQNGNCNCEELTEEKLKIMKYSCCG